jgi:putative DNA primase/helicase
MQAAVSYNPYASCPMWLKYLERSQPDPEMRAYLQQVAGYSLTGLINERAFFIHYGPTAAGKSVFAEVLYNILGSYAQALSARKLTSIKDDSIPTEIARMKGKRFVKAAEAKHGSRLDTAKIKEIVGGESITARGLYEAESDFRPVAKISLSTNYVSDLDGDEAALDRLHAIPWEVSIPAAERIPELATRVFQQEGSGVLSWALEGLAAYLAAGRLLQPGAAQEAKRQIRESQDRTYQFALERCEIDTEASDDRTGPFNMISVLYLQYRDWFGETYPKQRLEMLGRKGFSQELERHFRKVEKKNSHFPQLRLKEE